MNDISLTATSNVNSRPSHGLVSPKMRGYSDGNQIRLRLLNRLGITKPSLSTIQRESNVANRVKTQRPLSPLKVLNSCHNTSKQPLPTHYSFDDEHRIDASPADDWTTGLHHYFMYLQLDDASYYKQDDADSDSPPHRCRKVQFDDQVSVVEIQNRNSYTNEEKLRLWNNGEAIMDMSRKNEKEFYFEKYDWRSAIEEEDFIDLGDGTLVHPANLPVGYLERRSEEAQLMTSMSNSCLTTNPQHQSQHLLSSLLDFVN